MANPTNFNIYTFMDDDAPVIYNASTSTSTALQLTNLLDKVLVSGYGSKTSAGWTKPYQAGDYHVYQMGANSSGRCLQVYAQPVLTSNILNVRTEIFDAMTSATSGTGSIYGSNVYPRLTPGWGIKDGTAGIKLPWAVVANSACFYFLRAKYYSPSTSLGTVGVADIISYDGVKRTLLMNEYTGTIPREVDEGIDPITGFAASGPIGGMYLTNIVGGHMPPSHNSTYANFASSHNSGRVHLVSTEYFSQVGYGGGTWSVTMGDRYSGPTFAEPIYVVGYASRVVTMYGRLPGAYRVMRPLYDNNSMKIINNFFLASGYRQSYADSCGLLAFDSTGDWYGGA